MPRPDLKSLLAIDALTCFALFLLCLFFTAAIATLTGLPPLVISLAGWILLPSAALMLIAALGNPPHRGLAKLVVAGNLAWVAASFAILAIFWAALTPLGAVLVAGQAGAVLILAWLEARAIAAAIAPKKPEAHLV